MPWAAFQAKPLTVFFLNARTPKVILCLDSDTAGSEACTRLAQSIPGEIAVIRLVPARKDWNDVLRQQGDIPSRKFIAETITLRELPTAQPVPMLRMADVEEGEGYVFPFSLFREEKYFARSTRGRTYLFHTPCGGLHQSESRYRIWRPLSRSTSSTRPPRTVWAIPSSPG